MSSSSPYPKNQQIYLNFPVGLPQRRNAEQVLNEHYFYKHNRIGSGAAVVMAIVRVKSFIQPFIIHDLFYFSQQMVFR